MRRKETFVEIAVRIAQHAAGVKLQQQFKVLSTLSNTEKTKLIWMYLKEPDYRLHF